MVKRRVCSLLGGVSLMSMLAVSVLFPGSAAKADPVVPTPPKGAESAAATDFNGDGFADLAVGETGAVQVMYGSTSGLRSAGNQRFTRADMTAAPPANEWGVIIGLTLATGDFDGDGFCDLAIGDDGAKVGGRDEAGAVHVLYGSAAGLSVKRSQYWTQDTRGVQGRAEAGDRFGVALAAADLGRDGAADLVVGVPFEDVGRTRAAGIVMVLYGSRSGLTAAGDQVWSQDSRGIRGQVERFEQFGRSLATADFDGSGPADVAVGVPFESIGTVSSTGGINLILGSAEGLAAAGNQFWSQASPDIVGDPESEDYFGLSLAAGHLAGRRYADLAVSIKNEFDVQGAVQVIYGAEGGLTAEGNQLWSQQLETLPEGARAGGIREALTIANFGKDAAGGAYDDLAIGTGGEGPADSRFGGVLVLYGSAQGATAEGSQFWSQDSPGVPGTGEPDAFGEALAGADYGNRVPGTGYADLAIGSPYERLGRAPSTGRVHVLYGTAEGLTAAQVQVFDLRTFNRPLARNANFGGQLSATGP